MLFSYPLMVAIQQISADRPGHRQGHRRQSARQLSPRAALRLVGLLLVANTINLGADLGAMGAALKLLIGGPPC
jgi:hypothetical protein